MARKAGQWEEEEEEEKEARAMWEERDASPPRRRQDVGVTESPTLQEFHKEKDPKNFPSLRNLLLTIPVLCRQSQLCHHGLQLDIGNREYTSTWKWKDSLRNEKWSSFHHARGEKRCTMLCIGFNELSSVSDRYHSFFSD
ncbi:hypothetical protein STEG23_016047 [Scotinomys teguina]